MERGVCLGVPLGVLLGVFFWDACFEAPFGGGLVILDGLDAALVGFKMSMSTSAMSSSSLLGLYVSSRSPFFWPARGIFAPNCLFLGLIMAVRGGNVDTFFEDSRDRRKSIRFVILCCAITHPRTHFDSLCLCSRSSLKFLHECLVLVPLF